MPFVPATEPYPWPYDGELDPARFALVVAGAQQAWVERSLDAERVTGTLVQVATRLRQVGGLVVVLRHARTARRRAPSLPPARTDSAWLSVPPISIADVIVDAGGIDGFHASNLDDTLRARGVDHLVIGGFGHEAAVDSTLRSANDRGYECLLLTDAVASFEPALRAHAFASVAMSGGIFGALGTSSALLTALPRPSPSLESVP